jgi:tRNA uridine 5-carboxymethylaminomethyl modification enzyme
MIVSNFETIQKYLGNHPNGISVNDFDEDVLELANTEIKYEGYIRQHRNQIERLREYEEKRIPQSFKFSVLRALSSEAREVLEKVKPETIGQASRLRGVAPTDISILIGAMK